MIASRAPLLGDLLVGLLVLLAVSLYLLYAATRTYWKRRGVACVPPVPLLGNLYLSMMGRRLFAEDVRVLYEALKHHGFGGVFQMHRPILMVCDPEMAKQVLVKDFTAASIRGMHFDEEGDPLSAHLFNLRGARWKALRSKLSSSFTSSKLKLMFPLVRDVADVMDEVLEAEALRGEDVLIGHLLSRFTTDVIATCAFGLQSKSLREPESEFYRMSRGMFRPTMLYQWKRALGCLSGTLAKKVFPVHMLFPRAHDFFIGLMRQTVEFREKHGVVRHDMVHLMMEIRRENQALRASGAAVEFEMTYELMAAQAFVFFVAGMDNVANSVAFCLHELALHQDLQDQLAVEVRDVLDRYPGGILSYDSISEMSFLDMVVDETLRKYTPVGVLFRQVTAPTYRVTGTKQVVLRRGDDIIIPVSAFHRDERLFPQPDRFDPQRFSAEAKRTRHPYAFLPFGDGPRGCVAERFARMEVKLALASLVRRFRFQVGASTRHPVPLHTKTRNPTPCNGVPLRVSLR